MNCSLTHFLYRAKEQRAKERKSKCPTLQLLKVLSLSYCMFCHFTFGCFATFLLDVLSFSCCVFCNFPVECLVTFLLGVLSLSCWMFCHFTFGCFVTFMLDVLSLSCSVGHSLFLKRAKERRAKEQRAKEQKSKIERLPNPGKMRNKINMPIPLFNILYCTSRRSKTVRKLVIFNP